mmetsp:Transcript_16657/g.16021  ORF Transcript_16657/g.16021 Transcript_16657/m.16021 type:complete len:225 (+) Transcript_16657:62-736(+)
MMNALRFTFLFSIIGVYCTALKANGFKPNMISRAMIKSASVIIASVGLSLPISIPPANAFGPVELTVKVIGFSETVLCNGQVPLMPGQKAMLGLFPICIQVEAEVNNPEKTKSLKDVSVYGFVKDDAAGNSVLPNNPDFKSDSGQYAMIKLVPPGISKQKYQFVAAITEDPKGKDYTTPSVSFMKTKAVSFPGGEKFQPLSECEMDPRADGCQPGDEDYVKYEY